jgi:uncharacterized membrane protein YbhN (UPF0104 family)
LAGKQQPSARRWLLIATKLLLVALVVWFIRRTILDAWQQLGLQPCTFDFWWLAASGGLYLLGTFWCALFWYRTLRVLGQPVNLPDTLRAYYVGQLGKYVPGKAMVVVLRTGMVRAAGGETGLAAASVFFETLTMMSSGALLSACILAVWLRDETLLLGAALAIMAVAGIPTLPPVFRRLVRLVGVGRSDPAIGEKLARLGYRTMLLGWLLTGLGWIILGLSFSALLQGLKGCERMAVGEGATPAHLNPSQEDNPHDGGRTPTEPPRARPADRATLKWEAGRTTEVGVFERLDLHTAAVAMAMVAGFVSFIPGGAIVREAVLAQVMVPYLGNYVALLSAIVLRLTWLAAELMISGILVSSDYAFRRRSRS